jgi:hypothetical protein
MLAIFEALSHSSQEGNLGLTVSGLARALGRDKSSELVRASALRFAVGFSWGMAVLHRPQFSQHLQLFVVDGHEQEWLAENQRLPGGYGYLSRVILGRLTP